MAMEIDEPYELMELRDRETVEFAVTFWRVGEMVIHPRYPGAPEEKRVRVLRLWVPEEDKPRFPHYWDVTSKRVIAQLVPMLEAGLAPGSRVRITASGVRPRKWFTVEVVPP